MSQTEYDVLVIGAGPGGYVAALRCAQLGLKVACVDSQRGPTGEPAPGGTCLNVGCIPSKALLDSSHLYSQVCHGLQPHGITVGTPEFDLSRMMTRKDQVVQTLTQGVATLLRRHKVDWLPGHGALLEEDGQVQVSHMGTMAGEQTVLSAEHIIIATGSVPASIPCAVVNHGKVVDSTDALSFTEVPPRLGVIGAGVIGLELGSVWSRLGSEVILLEALSEFLPAADRDVAALAERLLRRQGLQIQLGARVEATGDAGQRVRVSYRQGEQQHELEVDKLIVAVGRRPNTSGLGLRQAGVQLTEEKFIKVDGAGRTGCERVYAIGDVTGGPMLAHKAAEEGVRLAERIAGQTAPVLDPDLVPWVIYTWPEIAWVGSNEQELRARGRDCHVGSFPFAASGRARAMAETDGLVKILADRQTDRVLGFHAVGASASELIAEAVIAMEAELGAEDLARTMHAHPTLSEITHEAALAAGGRALHI